MLSFLDRGEHPSLQEEDDAGHIGRRREAPEAAAAHDGPVISVKRDRASVFA